MLNKSINTVLLSTYYSRLLQEIEVPVKIVTRELDKICRVAGVRRDVFEKI
jgi:hypothetical protein